MTSGRPPLLCCAVLRHQSAVERSVKMGIKTGSGHIDKRLKKAFSYMGPNAFDFEGTFFIL